MFTLPFVKLGARDTDKAGGKGASLGEMTQAGILVPPGFVILVSTFEQFIHEAGLAAEIEAVLGKVDRREIHTIESAAKQIQALIKTAAMPSDIAVEITDEFKKVGAEYVAVRSSATVEDGVEAAWAGQLDSYLNTTQDTLLKNVQSCWASLFTPRAIFYRFEKKLHDQHISVAVVVQAMIQSEVSGIAFSVHPVTQDRNQMIIEAGFGLGEAIVSGQITPSSYVLEKQPLKIVDKAIYTQERGLYRSETANNWQSIPAERGSKPVLNDKEIFELASIILNIERHYGFPVDIEWAWQGGKFYIVQSRPITTLVGSSNSVPTSFRKEDYLLSFWVQGVSIFVSDIHTSVYKPLEVLYIIDQGLFKQYFTKKAYERALEEGLEFYSEEQVFNNYQKNLSQHCEKIEEFCAMQLQGKTNLSKEVVATFFDYIQKLCGNYAQMNFERTDKAFLQQETNPVIKKNLAEVAKFKDTVRAVMNTVLFEPGGGVDMCFSILAKQFNLPRSLLDNLTQREILELFDDNIPDQDIVMKRQEAFVESYNIDGWYEGDEAQRILGEFREKAVQTNAIWGQVASKGKVVGKVKIIPIDYSDLDRVSREIQKMNEGDILIAETTAPELIVACKKAGAIVTDMGGLMSHAAIVSREFGIPCIVGTKNATQLLKDGDEVEVDADNGVVHILKGAI